MQRECGGRGRGRGPLHSTNDEFSWDTVGSPLSAAQEHQRIPHWESALPPPASTWTEYAVLLHPAERSVQEPAVRMSAAERVGSGRREGRVGASAGVARDCGSECWQEGMAASRRGWR